MAPVLIVERHDGGLIGRDRKHAPIKPGTGPKHLQTKRFVPLVVSTIEGGFLSLFRLGLAHSPSYPLSTILFFSLISLSNTSTFQMGKPSRENNFDPLISCTVLSLSFSVNLNSITNLFFESSHLYPFLML